MAQRKEVIPSFLGIGAPKCATTWLSEVLRKHPDVYVAHGKELVYFSSEKKFSLGRDWYLNHFSDASKQQAVGEFSVSYMGAREVAAQRVFEFNPDMKLIVVLRDPVQRAFSHYYWLKQLGKSVEDSFTEALMQNSNILNDSLYYENLKPFWHRFPEENILILKYEELRKDTVKTQRDLFRFLGVDECFDSGLANTVVGKTITPRSKLLEKLRIRTHTFLRKRDLPFLITLVKRLGVSNFYRKINDQNTKREIMRDEYLIAANYFKEDVDKLTVRSGMNFSDWLVWSENE